MAARTNDPQDVYCLATATILTAGAALEAILAEFVLIKDASAFTKPFSRKGVPEKYSTVKAMQGIKSPSGLSADHPDVDELWAARNAVTHSEPNHPRSRNLGLWISADGARQAAQIAEGFARSIWGKSMPDWLCLDLDNDRSIQSQ